MFKRKFRLTCAFVLIILIISHLVEGQVIYVVNSIEDHDDLDLADKVCADQFGKCTLRAAIQNANKTTEKDYIIFQLEGTGPFTIKLNKNLPKIFSPLVIDGTSQSGYKPIQPQVILSGFEVKSNIDYNLSPNFWANGLQLMEGSSGSFIKGLAIIGFEGMGIRISNSHQNHIASNLIGIHPNSNSDQYGNVLGISIDGNDNLIGGYSSNERNVISANEGTGINIKWSGNRIVGNFIGTDIRGEIPIGNNYGIHFETSTKSNLVMDNLISGNHNDGIRLSITKGENLILSNKIGTNHQGNRAVPNKTGISLWNNIRTNIGSYEKGNLISGNEIGIHLISASQMEFFNIIKANLIGVDHTGTQAIPNKYGIIVECAGNIIGSLDHNEKNLISGNTEAGILVKNGSLNLIQGNFIGTDKTGKYTIPNGHGVVFESSKEDLATTENLLSNNVISGNTSNGVYLREGVKDNLLIKNKIGLTKDGQLPLPNGLQGVLINSDRSNCLEGNEGIKD